jgi:hypothetical protein
LFLTAEFQLKGWGKQVPDWGVTSAWFKTVHETVLLESVIEEH